MPFMVHDITITTCSLLLLLLLLLLKLRSNPLLGKNVYEKIFFVLHIKMLNLSLDELKVIAKKRGIKGYKSMSKDDLTKIPSEPKTKLKLSEKRKKDIREDSNELRDRFLKPKIKEIRRNLYEIENKKNLSKSKIKEIE